MMALTDHVELTDLLFVFEWLKKSVVEQPYPSMDITSISIICSYVLSTLITEH